MICKERLVLAVVTLVACGGGEGTSASGSGDTSSASSTPTGSDDGTDSTPTSNSASEGSTTSASTEPGDTGTSIGTTDASADTGPTGDDSGSDDGSDDDGTTGVGGEANVLYVHTDGQDSNEGTVESPMRTIQWAIAQAEQQGGIDMIRVAEGDYGYDYANDDHIVVVDGISLFGGWRSDWGDRDPVQYPTRLVDESPTPIPSTGGNPHRAIEVPSGVGIDTVISGFHIEVDIGQFRAGVFMQGDATITESVIAPVVDESCVATYGVAIFEASPVLSRNRFDPDVVEAQGQVIGVYGNDTDGVFIDNIFDLSGVDAFAYGMWLSVGSPAVLANSIWLPEGSNQTGIWLSAATPRIDNNLIESEDLSDTCIWSTNAASVPSSLRSNLLDCYYPMFGSDPLRSWTTIMQVEGGTANAENNLKLAANVTSPASDMALDGQSPCTVTRGGADITDDVADDFEAVPRTPPLSIGAREYDGACQ